MKYIQLLGILGVAVSAFAQSIDIASPVPGQFLVIGGPSGENFTVEVDLPDTISPSQSVSVVVSLQNCGESVCPVGENDEILGEILFAGDYVPQRHETFKPPYQNFTFDTTVAQPGNSTIHVAHFFLLGLGPTATLETKNVSVIFQGFR